METTGVQGNHPGDGDVGLAGLRDISSQTSVDLLEAGVKISSKLLDSLRTSLQGAHSSTAVARLIDSISDMQHHAETKRTVVGVVGSTGSGKSSIINAVVDEERIIPTNCVRACTAVITELSYNKSNDPAQAYRGEIEFISKEDWVAELSLLFGDLSDSQDDTAQGSSHADPAAVVAKAKLMAVYPQLAKSNNILTSSTPTALANDPSVLGYLDSIKTVNDQSPQHFYEKLQKYVDSKEKLRDKKSSKPAQMELWPLIKVVRVYVKSDALSTGLVLVDLPGIQDSNAARAAVADSYMKECTNLWIVAPISRAVDDKASQQLLGDSFKRQLQMDGSYNNVTFICSKTDDISVTEAIDNLSLSGQMEQALTRKDEIQKELQMRDDEYTPRMESFDNIKSSLTKLDRNIDVLEDSIKNPGANGCILVKASTPMKRKRSGASSNNRKKPRGSTHDQMDQGGDDGFSSSTDDGEDDDEPHHSLTIEKAKEQLEQLKSEKRALKNEKKELRHVMVPLKARIGELKAELRAIESLHAVCMIRERNGYAKPCIKDQFAQGIREVDEEMAAAADDQNFDPTSYQRDYDDVARSLPVFCVSSRAFHKLKGRLEKDGAVHGYEDERDTEIPQLVEHAKQLTIEARVKSSKIFLNEVRGLVNSLSMWIMVGQDSLQLADDAKKRETEAVEVLLARLNKELNVLVDKADSNFRDSLTKHIFAHFLHAESAAKSKAAATVSGWTAPKDQGGMSWMTFKATCRRNGVFCGSAGPRNFNEELAQPLKTSIAADWERTFTKNCPSALERYKIEVAAALDEFHRNVTNRAGIQKGSSPICLDLVGEQIATYSQSINNDMTGLWNSALSAQKEANREFTPVIMGAMGGIYHQSSEQRGIGCYKRAKDAMMVSVNNNQGTMFHAALSTCEQSLGRMCDFLRDKMLIKIDAVCDMIKHDYMNLAVGTGSAQAGKLARENLRRLLATADLEYKKALSSAGHGQPDRPTA